MIVDGTNAILGRLASSVVKELKKGETIEIINAEKILITGDPHSILKEYNERRARGSKEHGPFFPKKADLIVKRTIRGMLPYKQEKGRILFKKVRVYTGVPKAFQNKEAKSLGKKEITCPFITVGELSRLIGG